MQSKVIEAGIEVLGRVEFQLRSGLRLFLDLGFWLGLWLTWLWFGLVFMARAGVSN